MHYRSLAVFTNSIENLPVGGDRLSTINIIIRISEKIRAKLMLVDLAILLLPNLF
jgi:hypothetical protein